MVSAAARAAAARVQKPAAKAGVADADEAEPAALPAAELRKIKCWDKTRALELLGQTLGLFKERVEIEVTQDLAGAIEAARARVMAAASDAAASTVGGMDPRVKPEDDNRD